MGWLPQCCRQTSRRKDYIHDTSESTSHLSMVRSRPCLVSVRSRGCRNMSLSLCRLGVLLLLLFLVRTTKSEQDAAEDEIADSDEDDWGDTFQDDWSEDFVDDFIDDEDDFDEEILAFEEFDQGESEQKRKFLQEESLRSGSYVILNDTNYEMYAIAPPRLYHLIILFTASDPIYGCNVCDNVLKEFEEISSNYWKKQTEQPADKNSKLFFVVMDFSHGEQAYTLHELDGIPQVIHMPLTTTYSKSTSIQSFYKLSQMQAFPVAQHEISVYKLAQYISHVTSINLVPDMDPSGRLQYSLYLVMFGFLAQLVYSSFDELRTNKYVWFGISMFVYGIATSGFIYCIIRGAMPFYPGQKGQGIMFIHPSRDAQFMFEGLFIAALNFACSALIYAILEYLPRQPNEENRSVGILICLGVFAMIYINISILYKYKAPWYLRFS